MARRYATGIPDADRSGPRHPVLDTGDSFTPGVVARIQDGDAIRPMTVLSQVTLPAGSGPGTRLTIVHDDATDTVKLYGDGRSEYPKGDVDEIRGFEGALRDRDVIGPGPETGPCLCS